jgi:hypothetical protein
LLKIASGGLAALRLISALTLQNRENMENKLNIELGIIIIIISSILFLLLFAIPFLKIPTAYKIGIAAIELIVAEVLFWIGGFLVGKELFAKYKKYLNPKNWFN